MPGRRLLAVGANPLAARFSALPVDRIVVGAHTASGALAGFAAVLVVSRLAVGSPAIGQDWLLTSFAAPVLGGTILSGGKVSVVGTVLGAALLAMIANALVIVGVSQYWYQAGLGLIILGAVSSRPGCGCGCSRRAACERDRHGTDHGEIGSPRRFAAGRWPGPPAVAVGLILLALAPDALDPLLRDAREPQGRHARRGGDRSSSALPRWW